MDWKSEMPQENGIFLWWSKATSLPCGIVVVGVVNPGCGWVCADGKTRGYITLNSPPAYKGFPPVLWAKVNPPTEK